MNQVIEAQDDAPDTPEGAAAYLATLMAGKVDALPVEVKPDADLKATPAADPDTPPGQAAPVAPAAAAEPVMDASNTAVLSKDGKYLIEYEKLAEAREGRRAAQEHAAELEAQLKALTAQASNTPAATPAANAALAQQAIDAGVSPEIFGDFSEEALAKGVGALVDARLKTSMAEVNARLDAVLTPIQTQQAGDATQAHMSAIYTAHADADSIVDSKEFNGWIDSQPTFARNAFRAVLDEKTGGTAQEVIELFDAFKAATGRTSPAALDTNAAKAAAKAAIANAGTQVPTSLSDIPGGRSGATDKFEALDAMPEHERLAALMRMNQADRDTYMSR